MPLRQAGADQEGCWRGQGQRRHLHKTKVGTISASQLRDIATTKMPDLNANTIEAAEKIIAGTARSMGITVQR